MAQGLVYISTATASGDTSVSVDDVFTTTHDHYVLIFGGGLGINTQIRLRASGSDATGSNYGRANIVANGTTWGPGSIESATFWYGPFDDEYAGMLHISFPATAVPTTAEGLKPYNPTDPRYTANVFVYDQNTVFDGFTFYVASGTMTGTVDIYGMVK